MAESEPREHGTSAVEDCADEAAPRDPFARIASPILRRACVRVASSWSNEGGEAMSADEVREEVVCLAEAAEAGEPAAEFTAASPATLLLRRRLLDMLRADLVLERPAVAEGADAGELVDLLGRLERVRLALEPRWDQHFVDRLSAPTGLELVVEVAHDLRSPLTSILFLSETLRRGQSGDLNDLQRRQLGIIYSAALALVTVASDVIELARGGAQLLEPRPSPFSITEVMERVFDIVRPMAEEKGLNVRVAPPAADQRLGYPVALGRVLLNLTTNALKFTDEGEVEVTARARSLNRIEFSVRDTGRGIPPDVLSSLYQPFRRSATRSKGYYFSGSGLGLAICRKLVEAMDSELHVDTSAGKGTKFYFELELPPIGGL